MFIGCSEIIISVSVRGRSRTAATSKMEHFVITVNGFEPLTIITNSSILDVAAVLDPPLSVKHMHPTGIIRAFFLLGWTC